MYINTNLGVAAVLRNLNVQHVQLFIHIIQNNARRFTAVSSLTRYFCFVNILFSAILIFRVLLT